MVLRIDKDSSGDWRVIDDEYVTIRKIHGIEDKIEFLRKLENERLKLKRLHRLKKESL